MKDKLRGLAAVTLFEARLILRCRYPRYVLLVGPLFLIVLSLPLLTISLPPAQKVLVAGIPPVFSSGTYLMYVFGWNAQHAEGLFALPIDPLHHVFGRLAASTMLAAVFSIPPIAALIVAETSLVLVPVAAGTFMIGALSLPVIWLALKAPHPIEIDLGAYAKLQMMTWQHQIGAVVLVSVIAFVVQRLDPVSVVMAGMIGGGMGAAFWPIGGRLVGRELQRRIPFLTEAFRRV